MSDEMLKKYMDEAFKFSFNFYKKETKLINELENLKKQLIEKDEKLNKSIEALEFYADKDNWLVRDCDADTIYHDDCDNSITGHGGKRARQILKEIKGKL